MRVDTNFSMGSIGEGQINFGNLAEESDESSDIDYNNLALQLLDGEEMNANMANFIGIHMMSELVPNNNNLPPPPNQADLSNN